MLFEEYFVPHAEKTPQCACVHDSYHVRNAAVDLCLTLLKLICMKDSTGTKDETMHNLYF